MQTITDDFMRQALAAIEQYCLVILIGSPKLKEPGADKIVWEHGRRNFALRADGVLSIVCPVSDETDIKGIYIFNTGVEEVRSIMDEDPGVKAGIFNYDLHVCRGFPGSCLPG
jgi:hypothetical protein